MKKLFFLILIFISPKGYSQVSIEYLNIVTSSANYTYVGIQYQPDYNWATLDTWNTLQNGLSARTSMYERGWGICNREYNKLMDLQLINVENKKALLAHQREVESWADVNFSKYDLAEEKNVSSFLNYFTWIYKLPKIRDEIRLLNELNGFHQFIVTSDPNKVNKGQLYEELNTVLLEMRFWNGEQLSRSLDAIILDLRQRNYTNFKNVVNGKYSRLTQFSKVPDGWHYIYALGKNTNWVGRRHVYVSNGKVTIYRAVNGEENKIISGGIIVNQHCNSAIYSSMNSIGVYRDIEVEFYFLDL
jgi:hypothetical protein